ncbi:MAG TPA: tetratricopeptide repeat protein, partial [Pyrinomonadaceae bacterium]|nr:tetratricopeptide repeat protein [Pyrinomonadaceae bacterium]
MIIANRHLSALTGVLLAALVFYCDALASGRAQTDRSPSHGIQNSATRPDAAQTGTLVKAGDRVEREIGGGEAHAYAVELQRGDLLQAVVEQKGVDVVVSASAPDGLRLAEVDSPNGAQGPEPLLLIAESSGRYQLSVRMLDEKAARGRYELRVEEVLPATEADRRRAADAAALNEAVRMLPQASNLAEAGNYPAATELAGRALAIRERVLGDEHPDTVTARIRLARLFAAQSDFARAEPLFLRALAAREKSPGAEHPDTASTLTDLALLYKEAGDYDKSEALQRRALSIDEKALGTDHPSVAIDLVILAGLLWDRGDYVNAEAAHLRALAINEKAYGAESREVALSLNGLAGIYWLRGDYERGESFFLRAIKIVEKEYGTDSLPTAAPLGNLARLYDSKGDYAKAETLFRRALTVLEKTHGLEHPDVASVVNSLAEMYRNKGELERAEPLYKRTLSIIEKLLGPEHPHVATTLNNLALLYKARGEYERAEPLYLRVLSTYERAYGTGHPYFAAVLLNLAELYFAKNDAARAIEFLTRAQEVRERNISHTLSAGSERQKMLYLSTMAGETDATVSLHTRLAPSDARALELSLTTILRRKGRSLDAMADQLGSLRRRLTAQDASLLDELSATQARLSALIFGGAGAPGERDAAIARLEAEVERLQSEVARRSGVFKAQTQTVTLPLVRQAIPKGGALAEFFSYQPFVAAAKNSGSRFGARRYVVYILRPDGGARWADLGEAEPVDAAVRELRDALKNPARAGLKESARNLDERVMRPVRALLGDARHVFISPDGSLNLVPFAALVDEDGKFLIERYSFTYLTSGRDLLRLQTSGASRQPPLIFADPLFGNAVEAAHASTPATDQAPRRSGEMNQLFFNRLPGTADEASALGKTLSAARVLTQRAATEAALKQVSAPFILHVATHGFFLPDQRRETPDGVLRNATPGAPGASGAAQVENPLLRS